MVRSPKSDELKRVLYACRGYFVTALLFSLAINLLYLAAPLYMLQVYDRVISSGSQVTLLMLTIILLVAFVALAGLDAVRARVLTRASIRLDRLVAGRVMTAVIDRAAAFGGARSQLLRDFDTFQAVCDRTGHPRRIRSPLGADLHPGDFRAASDSGSIRVRLRGAADHHGLDQRVARSPAANGSRMKPPQAIMPSPR